MIVLDDMRAAWSEASTYRQCLFVLSEAKKSQVVPRISKGKNKTGRIPGWLPP